MCCENFVLLRSLRMLDSLVSVQVFFLVLFLLYFSLFFSYLFKYTHTWRHDSQTRFHLRRLLAVVYRRNIVGFMLGWHYIYVWHPYRMYTPYEIHIQFWLFFPFLLCIYQCAIPCRWVLNSIGGTAKRDRDRDAYFGKWVKVESFQSALNILWLSLSLITLALLLTRFWLGYV